MERHEQFVRRAIRLAMNGRGKVEPNPMVGCVLVRDGRTIGEGWHTHFGGPHAEPAALADCAARGESPVGATAYVTLEPCCHTNKKTPPCAPRLIAAKVARVVVGCLDPNEDVNGKGVAMLRAAGIDVGRCDEKLGAECKQLIAAFLLRTQVKHPYTTLKWAQTADGKIAGPGGKRMLITGQQANRLVHLLRSRSEAIMAAVNTILADDPQLTARGVERSSLHTRIILDSSLRTPPTSRVLIATAGFDWTIIYYSSSVLTNDDAGERISPLLKAGATLFLGDELYKGRVSLREVFGDDDPFGEVTHLIVEPGPTLARSFFDANLAHRLWVFGSPRRVDDDTAPSAATIPSHFVETGSIKVGDDELTEYLNSSSKFFFAAVPSADFVLAKESVSGAP